MVKICIFTPNFYPQVGGAERDVDVLARRLEAKGHEVTVLAGKSKGQMPDFPYRVITYRKPPKQNLWPEVLALPLMRAQRRYEFDVILAFYAYPNGYAAETMQKLVGSLIVYIR